MNAETKHGVALDVLAVMDDMSSTVQLVSAEHKALHKRIIDARAAMADLIEAAKLAKREVETVCRVEGHDLEFGSAVKLGKASSALHTALANVRSVS